MSALVAVSAERSEVVAIVGAAVAKGLDVVDVGGGRTAELAPATVAHRGRVRGASATAASSRSDAYEPGSGAPGAELTAHEARLQNHPTTSRPCG